MAERHDIVTRRRQAQLGLKWHSSNGLLSRHKLIGPVFVRLIELNCVLTFAVCFHQFENFRKLLHLLIDMSS